MASSLYPGFAKIKYAWTGDDHFQILPIYEFASFSPGSEPTLTKGQTGDPIQFNDAIDAYVAIMKTFFSSTVNIILAEAWTIAAVGADPVYQYTHELGVLGTAATASVSMLQMVMTYRSSQGGIFKQYFMDASGAFTVNTKDPYPYASSTPQKNMSDYLISDAGSWIAARDGGYVISPINAITKYNDALRKRRVLNQ